MLGPGEGPEHADLAGGEVVEADPHRAVAQRLEVRPFPPVGHEGQRAPVGGPGRLQVGVAVVGDPPRLAALDVDEVEVAQPAAVRGDGDRAPVRGPRGAADRFPRVEADPFAHLPLVHVEDGEDVVPFARHDVRQAAAVGRPGPRRVEEAERVEVRIGVGAGQFPEDLPRLRVGQEELDREDVLLGEEDDVAPVGAQDGGDVHAAGAGLLREEDFGERLRGLPGLGDGQFARLRRFLPARRERVDRDAQGVRHAALQPERADAAEERRDDAVPPGASHEGPEGVAEAVGEVARIAQLLHGRELVPQDRIAHPHRGQRVAPADR